METAAPFIVISLLIFNGNLGLNPKSSFAFFKSSLSNISKVASSVKISSFSAK